jgi:hypothetical protein
VYAYHTTQSGCLLRILPALGQLVEYAEQRLAGQAQTVVHPFPLRWGSTNRAALSLERCAETAAGLRRSCCESSVVVRGTRRPFSTQARPAPRAASSAVPLEAGEEAHRLATPRGP